MEDLDSLYKEARAAYCKQEESAAKQPKKERNTAPSWIASRVVLLYQSSAEPLGLFQEWTCGGAKRWTKLPDEKIIPHEGEVTL